MQLACRIKTEKGFIDLSINKTLYGKWFHLFSLREKSLHKMHLHPNVYLANFCTNCWITLLLNWAPSHDKWMHPCEGREAMPLFTNRRFCSPRGFPDFTAHFWHFHFTDGSLGIQLWLPRCWGVRWGPWHAHSMMVWVFLAGKSPWLTKQML